MAKKKKITGTISLMVPAQSATPAPPIGPALGQHGVNIKDFVDQFNDRTKEMERGVPLPVVITVFEDRSFEFIMKQPPNSYFIKKAAKLKSGSQRPGHDVAGQIRTSQIKQIAEQKMPDLNAVNMEGAMKILEGSARSMGIEVVEG